MNIGKLDLSSLPKFRDGSTFLYIDRAKVDKDAEGIRLSSESGDFRFPCAEVSTLMLGPGTSITHAAVSELAKFGCLILWCGEHGVRFYCSGIGETRSARNMERQATLWALPQERISVAKRMYSLRFQEALSGDLSLEIIRGLEGKRVQQVYYDLSKRFGIDWKGRAYHTDDWMAADPVNRALSVANTCLYGICHAGIVSMGFSPALGFLHRGKGSSFVYDVADFYKMEMAAPCAFEEASRGMEGIERRVRIRMREMFTDGAILKSIERDIFRVLDFDGDSDVLGESRLTSDTSGTVRGNVNYGGRIIP